MSPERLLRIVAALAPVRLWSSDLVAALRRRPARIRSFAGLFTSSSCLTTETSIVNARRRASSLSVRSLSHSKVSSASSSASTCGLSVDNALCVASSLRSAEHRNRVATFSRTNDWTRAALESDHRRGYVKSTPFGSPATSERSLGFAPPPHSGFAFLAAPRHQYAASAPYSCEREGYVRQSSKCLRAPRERTSENFPSTHSGEKRLPFRPDTPEPRRAEECQKRDQSPLIAGTLSWEQARGIGGSSPKACEFLLKERVVVRSLLLAFQPLHVAL